MLSDIFMYVCVYIYIYIYIYTHTYIDCLQDLKKNLGKLSNEVKSDN